MLALIVVVRYKMRLEDSPTMSTLGRVFQDRPDLLEQAKVLVWDNSPEELADPKGKFPFTYRHSTRNRGVSGGYNGAMQMAEAEGIPWLLLLDQDTDVAQSYLEAMLGYGKKLLGDESVATVVPFVRTNGVIVSPRRFTRSVRSVQIPASTSGPVFYDAYAVNSGTLMRVSALREIGGYSEKYWLDLSDAYVFHVLHLHGKAMYVAGDQILEHNTTTVAFNENMTAERYASFIAAENSFADEFRPWSYNAYHTGWLLLRAARQYLQYRKKFFAWLTLRSFSQRVFLSRARRRALWQAELDRRAMPLVSDGKELA